MHGADLRGATAVKTTWADAAFLLFFPGAPNASPATRSFFSLPAPSVRYLDVVPAALHRSAGARILLVGDGRAGAAGLRGRILLIGLHI